MNKVILKTVIVLALVLVGNALRAQTTFYDNYAFRIPLVLNNSSLGISTDQTNFVALLKVTSPQFVSGVCTDKVGGTTSIPPFAIVDSAYSTTTELKYQVEDYDATTGVIYFWVRVPVLYKTGSVNGSNKFYCYFGSSSPSVTHDAAWQKLTWSSVTATAGINYSGVWHFNEDPTAAAPQFSDATVNNNNLYTGSSGTVTQNTSSQIGNGITLNGTSVLDVGATNLPNSDADQSLSIWASYPTITSSITAENLIVLENSTNPASSGNGTQLGVLVDKTTLSNSLMQTWRWANRLTPLVKHTGPPSANTWHHYFYTYKKTGNISNLYVDGALIGGPTTSVTPFSGTVDMIAFGDYIKNTLNADGVTYSHSEGGQSFTGTMDESHVIGATLSADWVKAEYVNQHDPDAFTTAGSMQTNSLRASATAGYLSYTWKGINTSVSNASNWDNTTASISNEAPVNSNVNWVIPSGKSNYPVLTANTGVYALTIASGAYINLNGFTLSVGCNIYNNASTGGTGILNASNTSSGITWNGSIAAQGYYGTNTANTAEIGNMTVNNSSAGTVTITGGPIDIYNTLTITKGNLVIDNAGSGDMTLKSSSTLSASVAAIPSTYSITGNVNVERYISGGALKYRGYRFLSSPVYTAKVGTNYYFDLSYLTSYTPSTGTLGTSGGMSKTGNPSIYLYRDNVAFTNASFNGGNFRGVNKINNSTLYSIGVDFDGTFNLHVGTGFWLFYRGNTSNIATKYITSTVPEAGVFVTRGTLNQQAVTVVNWYTQLSTLQCSTVTGNAGYGGYNLVGNPYASSIDWDKRSTTDVNAGIYAPGVGNTIYIFNESTRVYGTYDGTTGINGASHIIPSGQGFYVKATNATAQLIFNEAAKTSLQVTGPTAGTGSTLLLSTHPVGNTNPSLRYMRLELRKDSDNVEESIVRFENSASNNYVKGEDSEHMAGSGSISFFSTSSDNIAMAINHIPFPKTKGTVIKLNVNTSTSGQYAINRTDLKDIPDIYEIWLKDAYKKDSLDIKHNSSYVFNILRSDTNSFGANRFTLVIRESKALRLRLLDFVASKTTNGSELIWKTENEKFYTNFTVERSTDNGKNYAVLGGFASGDEGTYSFTDKKPVIAADTYRIKLEDLNGTITYSKAITLMYANVGDINNNAVNIYPNPAVSTINLAIVQNSVNLPKVTNPSYSINITNSMGKLLKSITTAQPTWQYNVSGLLPGTYVVDVVNNADNSAVGKAKFIKL